MIGVRPCGIQKGVNDSHSCHLAPEFSGGPNAQREDRPREPVVGRHCMHSS